MSLTLAQMNNDVKVPMCQRWIVTPICDKKAKDYKENVGHIYVFKVKKKRLPLTSYQLP